MEPAAVRRDHPDVKAPARQELGAAAMEPAADGRDHWPFPVGVFDQEIQPQWSPPLTGGITTLTGNHTLANPTPQWSPPLAGSRFAGFEPCELA